MREPLEAEYFNWLCAKVRVTPAPLYTDLLRIMHQTEFVWTVLGDRNRAEDGIELRFDFMRETRVRPEHGWLEEPCSVLEMIYAFSNRASFQTDMPPAEWFWKFVENLELIEYRYVSEEDKQVVLDILMAFVWRNYDETGLGGLFPMRSSQRDQRQVEIWYQFCEYLDDQGIV